MKKIISFALLISLFFSTWSQSNQTDRIRLFTQFEQSKPDTSRVSLLIQIARYYFDQLRLVHRMDSVQLYLEKADELNQKLHAPVLQNKINFLLARRRCAINPTEDPKIYFLPVIDTCRKTGDKSTEAQAWMRLGATTRGEPETYAFIIQCHQNAIDLARQVHDKSTEIKARGLIAVVHTLSQKLDLAETALLGLLAEEKQADTSDMMYLYDHLAALYIAKNQYDKALQYALQTQHMMGVCLDSSNANVFYSRLSSIYRFLGKMPECLEWAKKDLDFKMATNNVSGIYRNIDYIAYLLAGQGKPKEALNFLLEQLRKQKISDINALRRINGALGDIYDDLKIYPEAEKSYLEMIRLGNEMAATLDVGEKGYDNCNMGSFYFRRGNYVKALYYLEIAQKSYEAWGQLPYIKVAHLWLFKTDSAMGNYMSAIRHLKENNRLGDSIFNIARNKQIEEMQVAYKTEQKDKDFRILQGKEQLGRVQLQNTKHTRNWIIGGASLLLVIAGLLYRLAVLRKKNNSIIKYKNEQLHHLLDEKEWLLKEVHHRVKNNLHTVIGLLESQAVNLQDDALKANEISKHRIYAMSLIHQQLYSADDIKTIDMDIYVPELLDYLGDSFGIERNIRFKLDVSPLKLGVGQAIPIGLIVNEAVTNSIKYAFLPNKQGVISISMNQLGDKISLCIADDGIGIDAAIANTPSTSMGLKLIKGLTRDIDGEINFTSERGTRIDIHFKPDPLNEISTVAKYN